MLFAEHIIYLGKLRESIDKPGKLTSSVRWLCAWWTKKSVGSLYTKSSCSAGEVLAMFATFGKECPLILAFLAVFHPGHASNPEKRGPGDEAPSLLLASTQKPNVWRANTRLITSWQPQIANTIPYDAHHILLYKKFGLDNIPCKNASLEFPGGLPLSVLKE